MTEPIKGVSLSMKMIKNIFLTMTVMFIGNSYADEIDDMLQEVSSHINKTMGGMYIDEITKLQNTFYSNIDKREFTYVYTILDDSLESNLFDWSLIQGMAIRSFCTDPDMKEILDYTTIGMSYQKLDGTFLHKFNFSNKDCKKDKDTSSSLKSNIGTNYNNSNLRSTQVNLAGKRITIPAPYGFRIESDKEMIDVFSTLFPKDFSIKAIIIPDEYKYVDDLSKYALVVSLIPFEQKTLSDKSFKSMSKIVVEQQYTPLNKIKGGIDKFLDAGIKNFNDKYDMDMDGSISEITSLGLFINKKDAFSLATIMEGEVSVAGEVDATPMVATISYLNLKNKLIVVYLYSDYIDSKDMVWIKSKTKEFVDLLLQANNK